MRRGNIRTAAISGLVVIFAVVLFPIVNTSATKCRKSDFLCFKRKMMPKVGHRITVEGSLASAKLGWIIRFDNWGVYIYAVQGAEDARMKGLDGFEGHTVKVTGTLRYSAGSPFKRAEVASVPEHFFFDVAEANVTRSDAIGEVNFRDLRFRKPPLVELTFDVLLRNDRKEPRWFLLPSNLGPGFAPFAAKGGVDTLEVFAPHGKGRVVVGHFLGTGGFNALLLPAGAELYLRVFPISYWGDLPDHLEVPIMMARRLTIGGEKAAAWFKVNPMCSAKADIGENVLSQTRMVRSRHTPDNKEVATVIDEDRQLKLKVAIKRKD